MKKLRIKKQALKDYFKEIIETGTIKDYIIELVESNYIGPAWDDKFESDLENQIEKFLEEVLQKIQKL